MDYQHHEINLRDFIESAERAGILKRKSVSFIEVEMKGRSHYPDKLEDLEI